MSKALSDFFLTMLILFPGLTFPDMKSSDSMSSTYLVMALFTGRAPNSGSSPFMAKNDTADGANCMS